MKWLSVDVVLRLHDSQIAEHGGSAGVRDHGLLEAALARPRNHSAYAEPAPDVPTLAALYAIAIAHDHPFVDGNKRTALVSLETFLNLHNYDLDATDAECVVHMLGLASRDESDAEFSTWVRNSTRVSQSRA